MQMKKLRSLLLLVMLAAVPVFAQDTTYTYSTNLHLALPGNKEPQWGPLVVGDLNVLDGVLGGSTAAPWSLLTSTPVLFINSTNHNTLFSVDLTGKLTTLSGAIFGGPVLLPGDPTLPLQAATKQYVDAKAAISSTITIGSVTEAESGAPPTVTNTGTPSAAVLNFTLPGGVALDTGTAESVVFYPDDGTEGGPTNISVDKATRSSLLVPGSVTTPLSMGYKQNISGAVSGSRDAELQTVARPENYCPNAGSGYVDAAPCFNQAISYLASLGPKAVKKLTPVWTPGSYIFSSINYLINGPRDFGDYHGYAGYLSPGAVSTVFAGGKLTACSVSGGAAYAPNAQLPVNFYDPTYTGTGANANVSTNSVGVPTSCAVTTPGMNYPISELARLYFRLVAMAQLAPSTW
jgi:hypothetical protein